VLSDDVRTQFLRFFEDRGHRRLASAGLVPIDDPTLLFTSAGMVPFKPYFMQRDVPPAPRLTTAQRCFRTTDIDSVGDISHNTFFEMLGNFSIGDYFKSDAIPWAWELVTRGFGLHKERLWNTVYTDDDEAFDLWLKQGQRPDRILRYGEEEGNYWLSGDVGPCGPCSEIFYDFGEELGCGPNCEPKHDCPRVLEIWNLVFMAFYQEAPGKRTPLPKKNVDTGAGLERITRVLAGVPSSYDTDVFQPILSTIGSATGAEYGSDPDTTRLMRIIPTTAARRHS
jgi:alanyl-tRNA synthetase